jgi:hypothetical protein
MLWRGHAFQGRHQPGRRAVLEETKEPSDRRYSTLREAFSQAQTRVLDLCMCLIFIQIDNSPPASGSLRIWFQKMSSRLRAIRGKCLPRRPNSRKSIAITLCDGMLSSTRASWRSAQSSRSLAALASLTAAVTMRLSRSLALSPGQESLSRRGPRSTRWGRNLCRLVFMQSPVSEFRATSFMSVRNSMF